ncbi:hypothetical protein SRH_00190 [Mesomycoplasma hyorhinis MCLD]|uniref:Uncharacterized protein n=1 Tax=Mesomycoplasma hyorhinis (strain MCLD) TaxID=936139 RepID=A0ABM5M4S2_MESHM|nr:hypothetical protein SRH_00190 [Mesomycoplasma hyorhinis MCLD]
MCELLLFVKIFAEFYRKIVPVLFFFFLQIWKKFTNLIIFKIIQEIFF